LIQLITGTKGSGKTKALIDMITNAVNQTSGNIVCIEKNMNLTYSIKHSVRLINVDEYGIEGYQQFFGFIAGLLAGNYDIMEVYIDGILKVGNHDLVGFEQFIERLLVLCKDIKVVLTVSESIENLPLSLHQYIIKLPT